MFATFKKISVVVLSGALVATLGSPSEIWARGGGRGGGGGGYGGGGYRGGYSGGGYSGGNRGYSAGSYSGGVYSGANRGYSGSYSSGYRGTSGVGGGSFGAGGAGANGSFSSRHFAANSNIGANGANIGASMGANRFGAYGAMGPYGMGYGGLGYGLGYGGLGYGVGYPFFGMYGMGGLGMMGMGMGMGGMGGGYGGGGGGGGYASNSSTAPQTAVAPTEDQIAQADTFDAKGEADFKNGNYQAAVQDWQHALVDTPHSGGDMLLLAQSLFATGQFQPAAGAVQLGMQMLPQDQWGNVVKHYGDLYPNNQDFTNQLRALETARTSKPDDPALRFLLGYEYGYLGYPKQAVAELDKGIALRPQDRGAVMIRNQFAGQAGVSEMPLPALPKTPAVPGVPATQPISAKPTTG